MNPFIKEKKQVSIFITAGFPNTHSLPEQLTYLQDQHIDFIEIGIPFSDPMADGPVIQETSTIALNNGMKLHLLFEQLKDFLPQKKVPMVLMGYLNPVLQFGFERFLQACVQTNISSVILPDLSLELYESRYQEIAKKYSIGFTFLVTPNTPNERIERIAKACENCFVYLVGQNSITGKGYAIESTEMKRYHEIKTLCGKTPLFLGFGIDSQQKKMQGFETCDGVIVGTAYLRALKENKTDDFLAALLRD